MPDDETAPLDEAARPMTVDPSLDPLVTAVSLDFRTKAHAVIAGRNHVSISQGVSGRSAWARTSSYPLQMAAPTASGWLRPRVLEQPAAIKQTIGNSMRIGDAWGPAA